MAPVFEGHLFSVATFFPQAFEVHVQVCHPTIVSCSYRQSLAIGPTIDTSHDVIRGRQFDIFPSHRHNPIYMYQSLVTHQRHPIGAASDRIDQLYAPLHILPPKSTSHKASRFTPCSPSSRAPVLLRMHRPEGLRQHLPVFSRRR